jgi:Glycosyltransferase
MRKIFLIGALPPPVQGMAVINQSMAQLLGQSNIVELINVSAGSLTRGANYHATRLVRAARAIGKLILVKHKDRASVYMSLSGGFGQAYELLFVFTARLKQLPLTLHHHSYAYVSSPRVLTRLVFAAAPKCTRHVALSNGMKAGLRSMYGLDNIDVISNAAFLPPPTVAFPSARPLRNLGFISNISEEKGIFDFVSLIDTCVERGMDVYGLVAGPFQDSQIESHVLGLLKDRPHIRYVGPKYGQAKDEFFADIDTLIFPSHYRNEAEPVTIHEAMARAIPVIAYGRGAIPEILTGEHGVSIPPSAGFISCALEAITRWRALGSDFMKVRQQALSHFQQLQQNACRTLNELLPTV